MNACTNSKGVDPLLDSGTIRSHELLCSNSPFVLLLWKNEVAIVTQLLPTCTLLSRTCNTATLSSNARGNTSRFSCLQPRVSDANVLSRGQIKRQRKCFLKFSHDEITPILTTCSCRLYCYMCSAKLIHYDITDLTHDIMEGGKENEVETA